MTLWKKYYTACSLREALEIIASEGSEACLMAGGTDLLLELRNGSHSKINTIVDISQVSALKRIVLEGDTAYIGAAATMQEIASSKIVHEHGCCLAEACGMMGGPQIRNVATLGGNVAHALPAADGSIALMALEAQVEIAQVDNIRYQPIEALFKGPGVSTLEHGEIIVGFRIQKRREHQASGFLRVMRPQGIALPILNMAVWIARAAEECIGECRMVVGPNGPKPTRLKTIEESLMGKKYSSELLENIVVDLQKTVQFRTSPHRATAAYRHKLSSRLVESLFRIVWEKTGKSEDK